MSRKGSTEITSGNADDMAFFQETGAEMEETTEPISDIGLKMSYKKTEIIARASVSNPASPFVMSVLLS